MEEELRQEIEETLKRWAEEPDEDEDE